MKDSLLPLYYQVEERLRKEIASGVFKEGELIPPEKDLAERYGVSPGTVRRAALSLKQQGLLERVQGKGTFVVFPDFDEKRLRHFRFVEETGDQSLIFTLMFKSLKVIQAEAEVARNLRVRKGRKVIRLERVGQITDEARLHTVSFLPCKLYRGLEKYKPDLFEKNTLWKIQEVNFLISIEKRAEYLSIVAADPGMAKILSVKRGAPLLKIELVLTSNRGKKIEYRVSHCTLTDLKFYGCQRVF